MFSRYILIALFALSSFNINTKVATRYGNNFKNEQESRNAFWKYWVPIDRVTPKTYPDLYKKIEDQSKKVGINKAPYAFVYKGDSFPWKNNVAALIDGVLPLLTKPFGGLIFIGSDLLERMTEEELDFVISHELGHLKAKQIACISLVVLPIMLKSGEIQASRAKAILEDFAKYIFPTVQKIVSEAKRDDIIKANGDIGTLVTENKEAMEAIKDAILADKDELKAKYLQLFLYSSATLIALSILKNFYMKVLEVDADLNAVKATGNADAGCSALRKLGARYNKMYPCTMHRNNLWNKLTFGLFLDQPETEERCRYMQEAQKNLEVVTD